MNNRHTPDSQSSYPIQNWNQQGNGGPVPFSMGQQTPVQQPSTNETYQPNGPGTGQTQYSAGSNQPYNAPSQPLYPAGPNQPYSSPPGQPPYTGGPNQQYSPPAGPQPPFGSGTYQQYGSPSGQLAYNAGPNQQYSPPANQQPPFGSGTYQQYGPPSGQLAYNAGPNQQYSPPAGPQPPLGSGIHQQYGSPSGQLAYNAGPNQQYSPPPAQPAFYPAYANNVPAQQKGGPGWKVLFFIIPVVLVVFASIFGPNVVRNMTAGNQPQTNTKPEQRAVITQVPISQQQLQGIQQYDDTMHYKELARLYTSQMTLDEEIGQLMVVTYNTNSYSQDLDYMLNQQHVGGVILYRLSYEDQLQTADQVKHDVGMMQQRATFPLFISIDEEGWNVDRLSGVYPAPPNPRRLAADDINRTGDPGVATSEGVRVAHDMMALGINVNFAPDVDVATYHGYIDWDYRAFGETPDDVLKYSAPYLEAMQKGGVIGTLKHFVGLGAVPHGNTNDPHFVLPSVDLTQDQLTNHLATFKHFIQSSNKLDHPGFIMPTDLMVPAVDPKYPTEFSHTFITNILRNQLGYNGVVITDGLQMGGVQLNGVTMTEANASVLALQAGCDMLLDISGSTQVAAVNTAIKSAIQDGTLTKARIDESVQRIIELKMERNVVPSIQGIDLTA